MTSFGSNYGSDYASGIGLMFWVSVIIQLVLVVISFIFFIKGIKFFNRYLSLNPSDTFYWVDATGDFSTSTVNYNSLSTDDYYVVDDGEDYKIRRKNNNLKVRKDFDTLADAVEHIKYLVKK
jgi:hypothetical protein